MANFNFNKVILGGRLTAAPELKQTPSGVMVTQFTVAVNRKYGGRRDAYHTENGTASVGEGSPLPPQSDFIRVTAWRERAEFVCRYFGKGSSICIVGVIQTRSWTDNQGKKQYATEVVADEVNFVDAKGEGSGGYRMPSDTDASPARAGVAVGGGVALPPSPQFETIADDEELPF